MCYFTGVSPCETFLVSVCPGYGTSPPMECNIHSSCIPAPKGHDNIARGNAPGTRNIHLPLRPERAIQHRTTPPSVVKIICLAPSGRNILYGALVPGALPQAMLFQSFGLKDPATESQDAWYTRYAGLRRARSSGLPAGGRRCARRSPK